MSIRVLFLYPNHYGNYMVPPAIGILSAVLKKNGHITELFDTTNYSGFGTSHGAVDKMKVDRLMAPKYDDFDGKLQTINADPNIDFLNKVNEFNPDLIAVSVTEDTYKLGLSLLENINDLRILTVFGGVFPTFAPEIVINNSTVDIVCIGEGENALLELCDKLDKHESINRIQNLWVKEYSKENVVIHKNKIGMVDMDNNPLIDMSIFDGARYYRPMAGKVYKMFPVEIFRGCPYKCTYCNSPSQTTLYKNEAGQKFLRRKNWDKIKEELNYYKYEMQAEYLYFWSDTFFSWSLSEFEKFCTIYDDIRLPFWIQTRPETVREDKFRLLKDIGCHRISFGIEHGNEGFRKKYLDRSVSNDKIIKSLEIVNEVNIPFSVNNIIGFPYETYELAFDTIRLNKRIKADSRNAYPFTPFHGTPLRTICDQLGLTKKGQLVESFVAKGSVLDMPQFRKKQVDGLCKTFNLYVNLPEEVWPKIKEAEEDTLHGRKIYNELLDEIQ